MKFTLLTIALFALSQTFEIAIKQEITLTTVKDDERVQQCVDVVMAIQQDVRKIVEDLKNNKPEDIFRRMLDLFGRAQDARERCAHLTPEEIENYVYHHLNRDGQKCVDGVMGWREVATLVQELANKQICFRQFINGVVPYIQGLPDLVDACKNAHIHNH